MATQSQDPATTPFAAARGGNGGEQETFIGRQPIVNGSQKLVAYELLFRQSARAGTAGVLDGVQATSQVVINTFSKFGVERVLGDKRAFINVSAPLLESDLLELLPANKVVLEILEDVKPSGEVVARCRALKDKGYQLALDDFVYRAELDPLVAVASFIKLDLRALGLKGMGEQVQRLRGRGVAFIAEKVETRAEYEACRRLLISHYQGYYFAKPEVLSMKRIDPSMQHLMQLFGLVSSHAEPKVIDAGFRQDVVLSYNLLRYINSVGFGLLHKVDTIRHALVVLGHAKLARWLTLLMFSGSSSNPSPQALFRMALIRARLMELLGRACLPAADHDDLFMSGMFSLLDAMLDTPLEELLKHVSLPEKVSAALLQQQGPFLPYLELSKACEENDLDRLRNLAEPLGVSLEDVTRAQMEAMAWAEDMAGAGPG